MERTPLVGKHGSDRRSGVLPGCGRDGRTQQVPPSLGLYYIAFDLTEPPLNNRPLRQALSMAIDRQALVALMGRGEQPRYGVVPAGITGHRNASYEWSDLPDDERVRTA
jgi:ABC-type oligopeptide transport system substrate-binding subunit